MRQAMHFVEKPISGRGDSSKRKIVHAKAKPRQDHLSGFIYLEVTNGPRFLG
jgi:hypothetical protein